MKEDPVGLSNFRAQRQNCDLCAPPHEPKLWAPFCTCGYGLSPVGQRVVLLSMPHNSINSQIQCSMNYQKKEISQLLTNSFKKQTVKSRLAFGKCTKICSAIQKPNPVFHEISELGNIRTVLKFHAWRDGKVLMARLAFGKCTFSMVHNPKTKSGTSIRFAPHQNETITIVWSSSRSDECDCPWVQLLWRSWRIYGRISVVLLKDKNQ